MNQPLRILHLEDDQDYSHLIQDLLLQGGVSADLVLATSRAQFEAALSLGKYDLILADYSLPSFNGIEALGITREKTPETPFVLVSGTIGEQVAIESLRAGATDYVLKQTPERLVPAVRRAIEEAQERARRRHAETELIRREKYFRAMTDNSLDIVTVLNAEGFFQFNSPSAKRLLGYEPRELIGRSLFALCHPEDSAEVLRAFKHGIGHPESTITLEFRLRHQDGSWIHLESVGQNRLTDPDIAGLVFNSRDITSRKRIEYRHNALSHLSHRLSSATSPQEAAEIIHRVADQLFTWDVFALNLHSVATDESWPILNVDTVDGQRVKVQPRDGAHKPGSFARHIMKNGAKLILRKSLAELLPDELPEESSRKSASLMFAPIRDGAEVIGILSVQSHTPVAYTQEDLETLQVLGDHCGGALERIHAEQALRETELRFRNLFENSPDSIFVEDFEGQVLDVNPAGCRLHQSTREKLVGTNVVDLVSAERRRDVMRDFKRLVSGELARLESESVTTDGRVIPVEIHCTQINYRGKPALLLQIRDISERLRADAALRSSEMLFHSVWENSVDGMRLTDGQGYIVAVNDAYCKLVGVKRAELEGNPFTVIYPQSEQPQRLLKKYQEAFRERAIERKAERRFTLLNGNSVVLENANSFVELRGQPTLLLGLFRDVTAQKRLEDLLRHTQKMDAIGQLAGGVAHDFNNILTVIHGHASLLLGSSLTGTAGRSAQQIAQAAERAAGLTRQLLTFSRRQVMQPRRLDLNEVMGNMTKMLGRILGEDVALQMNCKPGPAMVNADASMMEQVVLNLAVNARDAMPRGGQLLIAISIQEVDALHAAKHPDARQGRFVCLAVTDSGTGIPPEILRRIFEPFFTTKEIGKGTGLGLATVYGIVKQHQGWIEVESELGRGSVFRVYLPTAERIAEGDEPEPAEDIVRGGDETILVVEDEQPVRELVCSLLRGHGYRVLEAESGARALEVWNAHKPEIALLLTDVIMPDRVNGRELAEKLWVERPNLKVIFTSGYSADVVGREWMSRRGLNYVQKPYHPRKLAMAVRDCLDATDVTPAT